MDELAYTRRAIRRTDALNPGLVEPEPVVTVTVTVTVTVVVVGRALAASLLLGC
jgi:hypothetical protein